MTNEPSVANPSLLGYLWRHTWDAYRPKKLRGRIRGGIRVLMGKNASVPKGSHNTSIGPVDIDDYYGGLIFSVGGRDNYWKSDGYDGSGACVSCREAGESDVPLEAPIT